MTDEPENIVLQHLIAIRTRLDTMDARLGAILLICACMRAGISSQP